MDMWYVAVVWVCTPALVVVCCTNNAANTTCGTPHAPAVQGQAETEVQLAVLCSGRCFYFAVAILALVQHVN